MTNFPNLCTNPKFDMVFPIKKKKKKFDMVLPSFIKLRLEIQSFDRSKCVSTLKEKKFPWICLIMGKN